MILFWFACCRSPEGRISTFSCPSWGKQTSAAARLHPPARPRGSGRAPVAFPSPGNSLAGPRCRPAVPEEHPPPPRSPGPPGPHPPPHRRSRPRRSCGRDTHFAGRAAPTMGSPPPTQRPLAPYGSCPRPAPRPLGSARFPSPSPPQSTPLSLVLVVRHVASPSPSCPAEVGTTSGFPP